MPQRVIRLLVALFAIVQAGAPSIASVIDARLAASSIRARMVAHVDRSGERDCPPQHIDDCAICQHLSRPFGATRSTIAFAPELRLGAAPIGEQDAPVVSVSRGARHPRAPPVA